MYSHWSMFPSAFPFSCKQRAHTKVVITGLEEWDKNSPLCSFSCTIRYFASSSFLGSEKDNDRKQKGEQTEREWQRKEDKRGWERIYGEWQQRNERLVKGESQNQLIPLNWKYTCQQAAKWQVSPYCTGMFIRMSNHWYHKNKLWFICLP